MALQRRVDPIARFMQEHDRALAQLASLNKAVRSLTVQGFSPEALQRVQAALQYINEEVSVHNRGEEEALFPVLERYVEGPTQLMREEHKLLRLEYQKLRRAVTRLERQPSSDAAVQALAVASRSTVQLLVNHIHKENQILFPLVQKFLTRDALREVARRLA